MFFRHLPSLPGDGMSGVIDENMDSSFAMRRINQAVINFNCVGRKQALTLLQTIPSSILNGLPKNYLERYDLMMSDMIGVTP